MALLLLVWSLVWSGVGAGNAQAPGRTFARGQIIEHVVSESNPSLTFAIYLPSTFDPQVPAPVLYLMDPRRRARVPVELFREAAERYGYLLISSHDTVSDGAPEPNLQALQAMWTDTHDWFTVDDRRVYLGGFSGTARIAWLLARHLSGTFTGVIGAAAGAHPDYPPTAEFKFLYFGTVGSVDYNYHELRRLERRLAEVGLRHRIEGFDGPHRWMPQSLASQAIEWMELGAMRTGSRPVDQALVDAWWGRDTRVARTALEAGDNLEASWRYAAMARDYAGLRETADAAATAAMLMRTPEAQQALRHREDESRTHASWTDRAMTSITEAFAPGTESAAMSVADLAVELDITRLTRTAQNPGEGALEAQRRLNEIEVQLAFYLPREALARAEYLRAAYYLDVAVRIDDSSPATWYLSAVAQARLRETRAAVAALERAMALGFTDLVAIDSEPAFRNVSKTPAFADLVGRLRATVARK